MDIHGPPHSPIDQQSIVTPTGWVVWTWNGQELVTEEGEVWPQATMEAACDRCSQIPGPSHDCGVRVLQGIIWLYETLGDLIPGRVELTGPVFEEDDQYRARAARIVEVETMRSHEVAVAIATRYPGVEVVHAGCLMDGFVCDYWKARRARESAAWKRNHGFDPEYWRARYAITLRRPDPEEE